MVASDTRGTRIESGHFSIFHIEHFFSVNCVETMKTKKKRLGMANLKIKFKHSKTTEIMQSEWLKIVM